MDPFDMLPDANIFENGPISGKFLSLDIRSFKEACLYVHNLPYGYNSNYDDYLILFKENKGSCTMKHAVIAALAQEIGIPLYKNVGVYKFTEEITTGSGKINQKYGIPFTPMVHCFLVYKIHRFDLTEGNINGKKKPVDDFLATAIAEPFISRKDEYQFFRRILKEKVVKLDEMSGISVINLLKAREESVKLLKESI